MSFALAGAPAALAGRQAAPKQFFGAGVKHLAGRSAARQEQQRNRGQTRVVAWQITEVVRSGSSHHHGHDNHRPHDNRPTASVTFKTRRKLQYGQVLKVVGSHRNLGDWKVDKAPSMTWVEGDYWLMTVELPAGKHEFKVAASRGGSDADWEHGPNRIVTVPYAEAELRGAFTVVWEHGNPKTMAEEERDMEELKQLMEALEEGWRAETGGRSSSRSGQQLRQLSDLLEAERVARRAAEAERDELKRQAEAGAAEAAALVRNSTSLRAEYEQLLRETGSWREAREALVHERDALSAELSASYEQRAALAKERDQLAEQLWLAGERNAQSEPERAQLDARLRSAEEHSKRLQGEVDRLGRELWQANEARAQLAAERDNMQRQLYSSAEPAGGLRRERDDLANQLRAAREQLDAAHRDVRRLEEEVRNAERNTQVLKSVNLLLSSIDMD